MKSILLATASIVAFAGAAAAQNITFGGNAELGFNDDPDEEDGFFYEANLDVTFTTQLDNGLTANVVFTIPVVDDGDTEDNSNDYVLSLAAEGLGGLFFGDTAFAAETHWDPGFAMASDGFSEQDNETVLRGDAVFGDFETSLSALIRDGDNDQPGEGTDGRDYVDQIAVGGSGAIGNFALDFAYQEESQLGGGSPDEDFEGVEDVYDSSNEDFNGDEIAALAVGATFGGADLKFGYSTNLTDETDSYGVLVRYPFGPVTASASYTFEPDFDEDSWRIGAEYESGPFGVGAYYESEIGDEEFGIEAVYNPNELTTLAFGYIEDTNDVLGGVEELDEGQDEGVYVAARQAIGENAYVEASYSDFTDAGPDEVREGTTLLVGLTF